MGLEKQPGFKYTLGLINRCIMALVYGDLFMRVLNRKRPYERFPGSTELLYKKWNERAKSTIRNGNKNLFENDMKSIIHDFDNIELIDIEKPRVAVVGEILLKYHPTANNDLVNTRRRCRGGLLQILWIIFYILLLMYDSGTSICRVEIK